MSTLCKQKTLASLELDTIGKLASEIDTPLSIAVRLLLEAGQVEDVMSISVDPRLYTDVNRFADDYLLSSILKKSKVQKTSANPEKAAIEKWLDAERSCRATNMRFSETGFPGPKHSVHLARARDIVFRILGRVTERTVQLLQSECRFGPGSTLTTRGRKVFLGHKYGAPIQTVSASCLNFFMFAPDFQFWRRHIEGFDVIEHDELMLVPKNWRTHRPISVGPALNIFVQLGIGGLMRRRFRNFGVDLDTQPVRNRSMASKAHKASLATIDLSSASDTISFELVRYLLPEDWFELLCIPRVQRTKLPDGTLVPLEKFSAMGNGYTFELESIIFYALASAVTDFRDTEVFGDDIIVPSEHSADLIELLAFCGFEVNAEKTFTTGRFYESCGEDYFDGVNVRPFYLKGSNHDTIGDVFNYCNSLRRYAFKRMCGIGCDSRFRPAWLQLLRAIPPKEVAYAPAPDDSTGIWDSADRCASIVYGVYRYRSRRVVPFRTSSFTVGQYLASLHVGSSFTKGKASLRGRVKYKTGRSTSFSWVDPGEWI